jgi:predicted nucleic-acid-binding protein
LQQAGPEFEWVVEVLEMATKQNAVLEVLQTVMVRRKIFVDHATVIENA